MGKFDLAIFDLDGTLIDSEPLCASTLSKVLDQTMGVRLSGEEVGELYGARDIEFMVNDLCATYGVAYPENFREQLADAYREIAHEQLKPTRGAKETLLALSSIQRCVVSNSEAEYINFSLETVGLLHHLDAIFNVLNASNPKPAPDLFLHAAQSMNVEPARCIVLEDRGIGIEAALAAGMTTIGFAGNFPERGASIAEYGVLVIEDMTHFIDLALA